MGCSSFLRQVDPQLRLIESRNPQQAALELEERAITPGDDQIVYLFEYGTALQMAGDYKKSNEAFLKAEELVDLKDYHSLSRVAGSLVLNEGMVQYKGEDYEKVFINSMLAINFLAMGNLDAAQVETRKLNDKLYKFKFEGKKDYNQDPFAYYLSGLIWETNRKWDDAYIDYKKAYELNPSIQYLQKDLPRLAQFSGRPDELNRWKKSFGLKQVEANKGQSEVVGVFLQGWAPKKFPHPEWPRLPKLYPKKSITERAQLVIEGYGSESSQVITDLEGVAIKNLEDQYNEMVARRAAGIATKAVLSDQIRQKNKALGELAWIGLNLLDRADLRQWSTLPQTFQIVRFQVPPGTYKIRFIGLTALGTPSGEDSEPMILEVKPQQKTFTVWRSVK